MRGRFASGYDRVISLMAFLEHTVRTMAKTIIKHGKKPASLILLSPNLEFIKQMIVYLFRMMLFRVLMYYAVLITIDLITDFPVPPILYILPLYNVLFILLYRQKLVITKDGVSASYPFINNRHSKRKLNMRKGFAMEEIQTWVVERVQNLFLIRLNFKDGLILSFPLFCDQEDINIIKTELRNWLPQEKGFDYS